LCSQLREVLRTKTFTLVNGQKNPVALQGPSFYTRGRGRRGVLSSPLKEETPMKIWNKPQVREQEVGLEVTSYLPAEIDII
jgi:coenzyme PQQ precursor peptide PqqA